MNINKLNINKMKRLFVTLLLMTSFMASGIAYDFSAVCESGQTLYYNILSETDKTVEITYYEYFVSYWGNYATSYYGVTEPEGDLVIPEHVQFNDTQYTVVKVGNGAFYLCNNISSVTFPNSIIEIGYRAFEPDHGYGYFPVMTGELVLPESLQKLGPWAFKNNEGITAVCIPNSVKMIAAECFCGCSGLKRVTIGLGVEEIGYAAFGGCHSLDTIVVNRVTPPTCNYLPFNNVPKDIPVLIPVGSKTLYEQAEYWNEFTNFIETESLAVNENETDGFAVYPNPTDGEVIIDGMNIIKIEVYNITGQFIKDFKNNNIDISDQNAGMYILKVITPSGVVTKQIIKN